MNTKLSHHAYQIARLAESGLLSAREYSLLRFLVLRGVPVCDGVSVSDLLRFEGPTAGPSALASHCRAFAEREALRRFSLVFEHISDGDVKLASRHERNELGILSDSSLTYGEIVFSTFVSTMRQVMNLWKKGGNKSGKEFPVFVDLGSGAGRAVVAAAILFDFSNCIGIELLEGLHSISEEAARRLVRINREEELTVSSNLAVDEQLNLKPPTPLPAVEMIRASFFISPPPDVDFDDESKGESTFRESQKCPFDWALNGDVIFANSTCFTTRTLAALALEVPRMKNGTILVTFTRRIDHPDIRLISTEKHDQSWGSATVYICQVEHSLATSAETVDKVLVSSPSATMSVASPQSIPQECKQSSSSSLPPLFIRSSSSLDVDSQEFVTVKGNSTPIPPPQSPNQTSRSKPSSVSIAKNKTTTSSTSRLSPSLARVSPPNHNGYDDDARKKIPTISPNILAVHKGGFIPYDFDIWKLGNLSMIEPLTAFEALRTNIRGSPSPSPSSPHGQALRFLKSSRSIVRNEDKVVEEEEDKEEVSGFRPLSGGGKTALVISADLLEESIGDDSASATPQVEISDQSPDVRDGGAGFKCEGTSLFRKRALSAESTVGESSADLTQILQGFAVSQAKNEKNDTKNMDQVCVDDSTGSDELISSIMAGTPAVQSPSMRFQSLSSSSSGDDLRKFVLTRNTSTPPRVTTNGESSPVGSALLRMRSKGTF